PTPEDLALPGAGEGTAVGHFLQIQDMVHAVRQGRAPVITGEDALPSLAVIRAIYEAERSGGPVDVPPTAPPRAGAQRAPTRETPLPFGGLARRRHNKEQQSDGNDHGHGTGGGGLPALGRASAPHLDQLWLR
ncbi:MAG: hypothetical protein M3Y74_23375, partial [Chloroflexota bacterium]|nr:hypothetical protein [Chloroflexota bacterium]